MYIFEDILYAKAIWTLMVNNEIYFETISP